MISQPVKRETVYGVLSIPPCPVRSLAPLDCHKLRRKHDKTLAVARAHEPTLAPARSIALQRKSADGQSVSGSGRVAQNVCATLVCRPAGSIIYEATLATLDTKPSRFPIPSRMARPDRARFFRCIEKANGIGRLLLELLWSMTRTRRVKPLPFEGLEPQRYCTPKRCTYVCLVFEL